MIRDLWYKNAIIYSLSLDSFLDADGDGIGDFEGALRRLDYLQGLGITCIWLMPFQPSPRRDCGYDITDYYGVDPRYGSLGDFVEFSRGCQQRGIRLMMDLVLNHTSDQHPWFKAAVDDPKGKFRDYYVWADRKPKDAEKGIVFPGVQKTTWTYQKKAKAWYFHRFYDFQPDLNIANPEVRQEMLKIVGYWLELGVSGFRMDAVPFLIAEEGVGVDPKPAYQMLTDFRAFAQWRKGDAVFLAEANVLPKIAKEYFGQDDDRLHMMFNFPVNQTSFYALAAADTRPLRKMLKASQGIPATAQWANFLRNHDELDLGRLSQEERQTVFAAFGPEPNMQLYDRGIRRRLTPMLNGDMRRVRLAVSMMMSLPGTPVLRYGDEIGMGENLRLKERECARTPMQWSDEENAGFSRAGKTVNPVIDKGPYAYTDVNVAKQRTDPESLMNWTERVIRMRKQTPEIGWGTYRVLETPRHILALRYDWRVSAVITLHNFTDARTDFVLNISEKGETPMDLICLHSPEISTPDDKGQHHVVLEPYGYRWFRLGGLDDLIKRQLPPRFQTH